MKTLRILLLVLFFCAMGVGTACPGQADHRFSSSGRNALLVINRAPDFGFGQGCVIYIDGVSYGIISYNRRLETSVAPGEHVVKMQPVPNHRRPGLHNQQRIYVHAGKQNVFTLSWGGDLPVLK